MPLYLLIGPEGSGKTSTFLNSSIEPQLLAGQGTTPVSPTRLCNLWLAKDAIFAEIGGRMFTGDLARWNQLLVVVAPSSRASRLAPPLGRACIPDGPPRSHCIL